MRKGPSGVSVAAQALDEAEPSGDALDNGPYAIRVLVAKLRLCEDVRSKRKENKIKNQHQSTCFDTGVSYQT